MTFDEFRATLAASHPPASLSTPLRALWLDAKADWNGAHELVDSPRTAAETRVHAYLHRKEGDLSNARTGIDARASNRRSGPSTRNGKDSCVSCSLANEHLDSRRLCAVRDTVAKKVAWVLGACVLLACSAKGPSGPSEPIGSSEQDLVTLDPNDPLANFERDGNQGVGASPDTLGLTDADPNGHIGFFAVDPDAAAGNQVEIAATFRVINNDLSAGIDSGMRLIISDGASTSAIVGCVTLGGARGVAVAIGTDFASAGNYAAFVPVDWVSTTSITLRRSASGDAEIVEVNGTPPATRAIVPAASLPGPTRAIPSVEFGLFSDGAVTTAEISHFSSRLVGNTTSGDLSFTRFLLRDLRSTDRLRFRAAFELAAGSNGIDPSAEPVTVRLFSETGDVYDRTLSGFTERGRAPQRRWTLNHRAPGCPGLGRIEIHEGPNQSGSIVLRDVSCQSGRGPFDTINAEIVIGAGETADKLAGTAHLARSHRHSRNWRLVTAP